MNLLRGLLPSQDTDALLGDITEEARHRSRLWYWTQIVAVVLVGSWRDVRRHPVLAFRAVAVGIASLSAYFYVVRAILQSFTYLNSGFFVGGHWIRWSPRWDADRLAIELFLAAMLCLLLVGPVLTGWIVGRLHRAHGITMVICFAVFIAALSATITIRTVLLTSAWTPLNLFRLAIEIVLLTVVPGAIMAGGFRSTRPVTAAR